MGDPATRFGAGGAGLHGATQTADDIVAERCGKWCDRIGFMCDSVRDFCCVDPNLAFEKRKTVDGCIELMARNTALEGVENIFDSKGLPLEALRFLCLSKDPRPPSRHFHAFR
jgi:hypothetical protein